MPSFDGNEIAVIGMAGRFPGARELSAFWQNLRAGVESIRPLTESDAAALGAAATSAWRDPQFVRAAATLEDAERFDAEFFGYSPREAELMDPQHRVLLETAWEALEHAGYDAQRFAGSIGVFAGATINTYLLLHVLARPELLRTLEDVQLNIANGGDFLTTRLSYKLNLRGPSHLVQSACSTSLVAVHLACQSLLNEECDLVLAGGVSINPKFRAGYRYTAGGMVSPDGHCRAFDAQAQGTVFGSGVGLVVLKRAAEAWADGDTLYALIKGSAVNNDGALKVGYTAPSVVGQAQVIAEALANAGVAPETISYVEAHGTGTPLGDPVEVQALTKAFRAGTSARQFCALGSVKTNIGHLDAAAGVSGLLKTVLALQHREVPPSLHYATPNPQIDFASSPFYVNAHLQPWQPPAGVPRRAGVSAFGVGGTNAHVILEEAPQRSVQARSQRAWQLLPLAAKTAPALNTATENLQRWLTAAKPEVIADAAFTLAVGRQAFAQRRVLLGQPDANGAWQTTYTFSAQGDAARPRLSFLLTGQGAQHVGMGAELYLHEPVFKAAVDRCAAVLAAPLGLDLRAILFPAETKAATDEAAEKLAQTRFAQPALFVTEYALAQLWQSWGMQPAALLGHSLGEYVAACLAEVLPLEAALTLVAERGRLMQQMAAGAMLSVKLDAATAQSWLTPDIELAAVNGPAQCVLAGPVAAVEALAQRLTAAGIFSRRLATAHAFHTAAVEEILPDFAARLRAVNFQPPRVPYISNVTGTWITAAEATSVDYWTEHLRRPVQFADGVQTLLAEAASVLLEIGPGQTLTRLLEREFGLAVPAGQIRRALPSLRQPQTTQTDSECLLAALGQLWCAGAPVDWASFYAGQERRRIALPTYPFDRRRYWLEASAPVAVGAEAALAATAELQTDTAAAAVSSPEAAAPAVELMEAATALHPRPALATPFVAPSGSLETAITAIWQQALGVAGIGAQDNFFELGGDSLLAVQVAEQLRQTLKLDVPVSSLYEGLTVRTLAALLREVQPEAAAPTETAAATDARQERRQHYQQQQRARRRTLSQ